MARSAAWNRPEMGFVVGLVAVALLASQQPGLRAFQAPSELVGFQASVRLMRQLSLSLLDASQLYLSHQSAQPLAHLVGIPVPTLPLPVHLADMFKPDQSSRVLEDVWTDVVRKLRSELRRTVELTLADPPDLAEVLDSYEIYAANLAHLERPPQGADVRSQLINFIAEAVGVLGELRRGASSDPVPSEPSSELDRRQAAAVDTIKRNYAYLMQLLAAYDMVFKQEPFSRTLDGALQEASKLDISGASKHLVDMIVESDQ